MEELKSYALEKHVPIIKDEALVYILEKIKELKAKNILELGSAIGYSSINMALLDSELRITTIEKNDLMYQQCLNNVKKYKLTKRINCVKMDIEQYETDELFDLIFVDAAKSKYLLYLNKFIKNLKKDGLMIFDNLNFHGMYLDPMAIKNRNTRSLVKKINNFYEVLKNDNSYIIDLRRDLGDGLLILKRS